MCKKIVVVTGSPRKGGNSDLLAEAFITAAEGKGHTVQRFDAGRMKIGGCRACNSCFKTGKPCVFEEDFNKIGEAILEADAVIFATPAYWFSPSAQIKAVLDHMYSFLVGGKGDELAGKKAAVLACCMSDEPGMLDGVTQVFVKSFGYLKWECIGEVQVPKVANPGDVKNTDGCTRAAAIADLI